MHTEPARRPATDHGRGAGRSSSRTWWAIAALVGVVGLLFLVLWLSVSPDGTEVVAHPDHDRAATPPVESPAEAPEAVPAATVAPEVAAQGMPGEPIARDRWWEPGQPHDYGDDPDPFIRQPLDYGSDTPEILGDRISHHVYDLERVQDMVRRGDQPGSEIAQARGQPLTAVEREAARRVLQEFFDETVPDIDAIIAGEMTPSEGYERIGPRRTQLDRDLLEALGLSEKQTEGLWPHVVERNRIRDQLRD